MRILLVHDYYQQPGGEDEVFEAEGALLEEHGHQVQRYVRHNRDVDGITPVALARLAVWNDRSYREVRRLTRRFRADVVHVHNTLPLVSPAVYHAAKAEGAAVVQTLHNYRLLCPNGLFMRAGGVCESCLGMKYAWPSVWRGCYRNSRATTAVVAAVGGIHRILGTWASKIDIFIALTQFARQKFLAAGIPPGKVRVKPHFVRYDGPVEPAGPAYALFIGRLAEDKGVRTLIEAWKSHDAGIKLRVVGEGPLGPFVKQAAEDNPNITWIGRCGRERVFELLREAYVAVVPSAVYETFGRVVMEAFAVGTPVVVSRLGALAELVRPGETGLTFEPGDASDLATRVRWMVGHPRAAADMRRRARAEYLSRYTPSENYRQLINIYAQVLRRPELRPCAPRETAARERLAS